MFFCFLTKSIKNLEKSKKDKKADPNSPACTYMGLAILVLGFWPKVLKNLEKSKKTKKTKLQTLTHQLVPTGVLQFCFFGFLVFSMFFGFLTKSIKNLEKSKKKNKIADPNSPACTYMGLAILFFFVFFGFLNVFLFFDQKY